MKHKFYVLILLTLLLTACGPPQAEATALEASLPIPTKTSTLSPTSTQIPTTTSTPTLTPQPTPTLSPIFALAEQIKSITGEDYDIYQHDTEEEKACSFIRNYWRQANIPLDIVIDLCGMDTVDLYSLEDIWALDEPDVISQITAVEVPIDESSMLIGAEELVQISSDVDGGNNIYIFLTKNKPIKGEEYELWVNSIRFTYTPKFTYQCEDSDTYHLLVLYQSGLGRSHQAGCMHPGDYITIIYSLVYYDKGINEFDNFEKFPEYVLRQFRFYLISECDLTSIDPCY